MGLFSFGKSSPPTPSDKVWKTSKACLKGTVTQALMAIKGGELPVIITFFEESHQQLTDFLKTSGAPFQLINTMLSSEIARLKGTIAVFELHTSGSHFLSLPKEVKTSIFFLGHYPLPDTEHKVIEEIRLTHPNAPIAFCQSLDDALFAQLGTDNLAPLLERIGLTDDECIEHALVTKAIHRSLEKISEKVVTETKARSMKEWFGKNVVG